MRRSLGFLSEHGQCTSSKHKLARRVIFLWFLALICCSSALAQESTVEGLADRLSQEIQKAEKKHFFPKVLVVDFSLRPAGINALGEYLADQLSEVMKQKIGSAAVIDRTKLRSFSKAVAFLPLI